MSMWIIAAAIMAIAHLSGVWYGKRLARRRKIAGLEMIRAIGEMASGTRCRQCGHAYEGLAMDCACTNWGG